MLRIISLIWLLLVALLMAACLDSPPRDSAPAESRWRYDPAAPQYDLLPMHLQAASSERPQELAARICAELAGQLEFISSSEANSAAFTCRFEEAGNAFSMDFGTLVRGPRDNSM